MNMKLQKFSMLSLMCLLFANAYAANYYVSVSGNDAAAGTSAGTAWKTLAKVNGRSFSSGDQLFFKLLLPGDKQKKLFKDRRQIATLLSYCNHRQVDLIKSSRVFFQGARQ